MNPKERRVVIVESILSSTTNFRSTLAKALFQYFEVSFRVSATVEKVEMLGFIACDFRCVCDNFYSISLLYTILA